MKKPPYVQEAILNRDVLAVENFEREISQLHNNQREPTSVIRSARGRTLAEAGEQSLDRTQISLGNLNLTPTDLLVDSRFALPFREPHELTEAQKQAYFAEAAYF